MQPQNVFYIFSALLNPILGFNSDKKKIMKELTISHPKTGFNAIRMTGCWGVKRRPVHEGGT